ncbi:MAG: IS1595 family transposase [Planctomycetota bacterium]|nr:IS1595 family transposase [Planctomycetota bacterium]
MKEQEMNLPKFLSSLDRFKEHFPNEAVCWQYLRDTRWPEGFVCPRDQEPGTTYHPVRGIWVCRKRHHISVRTDTALHGTRQPLLYWFRAAFFMATRPSGIAAQRFSEGMSLQRDGTAYSLLQRLRDAIPNPNRAPLQGTVQVEMRALRAARVIRGQRPGPGKALVICAVAVRKNQGAGVRIQTLASRGVKRIRTFVRRHIAPGAHLYTDASDEYRGLSDMGYRHTMVHVQSGARGAEQLICIHKVLSEVEDFLQKTHHGVSRKHVQAYLNEFALRFKVEGNPKAAFDRLLGITAMVPAEKDRHLYRSPEARGWVHVDPPDKLRHVTISSLAELSKLRNAWPPVIHASY